MTLKTKDMKLKTKEKKKRPSAGLWSHTPKGFTKHHSPSARHQTQTGPQLYYRRA